MPINFPSNNPSVDVTLYIYKADAGRILFFIADHHETVLCPHPFLNGLKCS